MLTSVWFRTELNISALIFFSCLCASHNEKFKHLLNIPMNSDFIAGIKIVTILGEQQKKQIGFSYINLVIVLINFTD